MGALLAADGWAIRPAVDTNSIIDDPDITRHTDHLGDKYMVHVFRSCSERLMISNAPAASCSFGTTHAAPISD